MKKYIRLTITLMLILTAMTGLTIGCLAFDNTDNTYIKDELQVIADSYFQKEEGTTLPERNTYNAVKEYVDRIDGLRQVTDRDTLSEMKLELERGRAAGILSWIYYSHIGDMAECSEEELRDIRTVYETQKGVIDRAQTEFLAEGGVGACYTRLLNEIYYKKIELLRRRDNGNGLVGTKVDGALELVQSRCSYLPSYGEDAQNCKSFYAETVKRVELQTKRDVTIEELRAVALRIYPDKPFDMSVSGEYRTFFEEINSSAVENAYLLGTYGDGRVVAVLNSALETAVRTMIADSPELGEYMRAYYGGLREAVSLRAAEANAVNNERHLLLSELFDGFSLGSAIARAKDELTDYINGDAFADVQRVPLGTIVAEYTGTGMTDGILDRAENEHTVSGELFRAKTRCYWYALYENALREIIGYVGSGHELSEAAGSIYEDTDRGIAAGEYGEGGEAAELLASDAAGLRTLIAKAEATRFYNDNKQIIDKVLSGSGAVTTADKPALIKAIGETDFLYPETECIVSEVLEALGRSYKELTAAEILALVTKDGAQALRDTAAEELCRLVEAIETKNSTGNHELSPLMEKADLYLKKAETVKTLFDGYISDYLAGGDEYFGEKAEDTAMWGAEKIIAAEAGEEEESCDEALIALRRLAALEDIYTAAKGYETLLGISDILSSALAGIESCSTYTDITGYAEERIGEISELIRQSEIVKVLDSLKKEVDGIKGRIEGYEYMGDGQRQELISELEEIRNSAETDISTASDLTAIGAALEAAVAELSALESRARECELDACLADAIATLKGVCGKREHYSAENYLTVIELISKYEDELSSVRTLDEYVAIRNRGVAEILAVEDILESAKRVGTEELLAAYAELMAKKHCYSADGLSELEEIYTHSVAELCGFIDVQKDTERVYAFIEERIALMRGVRLEKLYTSDGLLATDNDRIYPDGYSISDKGYIGALWSEKGIPSDTRLFIEGLDTDEIADLIHRAARSGRVLVDGATAARSIVKALRRAEVLMGIRIELLGYTSENGVYRVSVLLPENIDRSDILGVVLVREDGGLEFFEVTPDRELLEFETEYITEYYVLRRGAVELLPLIICLSIIILCELCIVALLLFRRRRYRISELCGIVPVPLLLAAVYRPAGGNVIVALLGVGAAALAGVIGYLVYLEIRAAKKRAVSPPKAVDEPAPTATLAAKETATAPSEVSSLPVEKSHTEYKEAVSVDEADRLMSDREAEQISGENTAGYIDNEIYYGDKRAEINIDTISESFEDGDTVTLNSLKEKGLVSVKAGQVKILARGVLDKRLCVVAQDFSRAAVKMILLTGGEVVYTHSSPQRGDKKKG